MAKTFNEAGLPPQIDYVPLVRVLGEAHGAIGELNGLLRKNVLSPELLVTPLLTKEAVLSSRIEGTQATLEDVFEYEAQGGNVASGDREQDITEIINYRRAMNFSMEELKGRSINQSFIKKIHYIILDSSRGSDKDRGQFRSGRVYIGPRGAGIEDASYVPPAPEFLTGLLAQWESYVSSNREADLLVQIGVAHYQLEAIHPFRDGNGRVGRLLIPLFLYQREMLSSPLLYISEYFERNRPDYYGYLRGVTEKGDWTGWLKFFLLALITQSLKTQASISRIIELNERLKKEVVAANSVYAANLLDFIFSSPVVSFVKIKDKLKTKNPQTIYNLLEKFVQMGILKEEPGRKRNRIFVFQELLDILK
ncbi:MAG: Fic family protein [Candidatus Pacebacteria bacterium]|jgi:Fic family protein|nr:Fic family protein [Candidatus Paceibacterota bacterium]